MIIIIFFNNLEIMLKRIISYIIGKFENYSSVMNINGK